MSVKGKRKYTASILVSIITLLFGIFFMTAVVRTLYNLSKVVTEEGEWVGLSEEDRREKAYGDIYAFSEIIKKNTPSDALLLFITTDTRAHYLAKYFLYPRNVDVVKPQGKTNAATEYATIFLDSCDNKDFVLLKNTISKNYKNKIYLDTNQCKAIYKK